VVKVRAMRRTSALQGNLDPVVLLAGRRHDAALFMKTGRSVVAAAPEHDADA